MTGAGVGTRRDHLLLGAGCRPPGDVVHHHASDARREMDGPDFRNFMGAFLRFAGESLGKLYNLGWSLAMFLLPVVVLVLLWVVVTTPRSCSPRSAWVIVNVGVIIVSNAVKTPH